MSLLYILKYITLLAYNDFSNVDPEFRKHEYLMFPSKSIHTDGIKGGVMVSTHLIRVLISESNFFI